MKRSTEKPKMYIIRKYIKATDVKQALRKEPKTPVHDAWVEPNWSTDHLVSAIGFDNGQTVIDEE